MTTVQTSDYCHVCGRRSLFEKQRINHVLHLILSLVTLGIWSLAWITLGTVNTVRGVRCASCGAKRGTRPSRALV